MTKLFQLGQHVRHDRNVWYSLTCGVQVTDTHEIAQLEAEYKAHQRAASRGPVAPMAQFPAGRAPVVRSKGQHKTNREKRGNGRVE